MEDVQRLLAQETANWTVMAQKLRRCHWLVAGQEFFTLHAKFEELYNAAAQTVDQLAERLLAIGHVPPCTLADCLRLASLKEAASAAESASSLVASVVQDLTALATGASAIVIAADSARDHVSADLLTGLQADVEKQMWMLSAYSRG